MLIISIPVLIFKMNSGIKTVEKLAQTPTQDTKTILSVDKELEKMAATAAAKDSTSPVISLDEQIANYSKLLINSPDNMLVLHQRAATYAQKSYYDLAVADYSVIITKNSKDAKAYFCRALAQSNRNNVDQAIQDYTKVIALDPGSAISYNNRGLLYLNLNKFEKAFSDFNKALAINPEYAQSYYNRGLIYLENNDFKNAQQNFSQALTFGDAADASFEVKTRYRLAIALYNQQAYPASLIELNKCLQNTPKDGKLYTLRSLVNDALGNKKQAFDDRSKAAELGISNMLTK
jgi:tetratricopeptide (TPR) repeat protein